MAKRAAADELKTIGTALDRFAQIARDPIDRKLSDDAQDALRALTPRDRGRPREKTGCGEWKYWPLLQKRIAEILRLRDRDDPQSITEVHRQLVALAQEWIGPLTGESLWSTSQSRLADRRSLGRWRQGGGGASDDSRRWTP